MKPKNVSIRLAVIAIGVGLLGCRQKPDSPAPTPAAGGGSTQPATPRYSAEASDPVSAAISTAPEADQTAAPAIAVAVSYQYAMRGPGFDRSARLVVAAWKDGRMIWSEKSFEGGPPYRQGRTRPENITGLLSELDQKGLFAEDRPHWRNWGPDSAFTIVGVQDGTRRFRMESWHELFEAKGKSVATAHGVTALNGRDIKQVLAAQPAEYREPRSLWQHIRDSLQAALPAESMPVQDLDTSGWKLDDFGG